MARRVGSSWLMSAVAVVAVALLLARPPATAATPPAATPVLPDPPLPEGAVARIGSTALRAGKGKTVLFSPDGKVLSSFGNTRSHSIAKWDDSIAQFWDVSTRRPVHTRDGTAAVAFSPDGRLVAVSGRGFVRVDSWPVVGEQPLHELTRPGWAPKHLAFSPDGRRLATGCLTSKQVTLWDAITGGLVREFPTVGCEWSLEFSPDGESLATGSDRAGAGLYEVETGRLIWHHPGGRGQARFSPDGTLLAQAHDELQFWDVETGRAGASLKTGQRMHNFAFSPDGQSLAVSGARQQVGVWDLASRTVKWVRPPNPEYWSEDDYGVAFSPDGKLLAACVGYLWQSVRLWDAETGTELPGSVRDALHPGKVALSPDGKVLAAALFPVTDTRPPVDLFDAASGEKIAHLDGDAGVIDELKFSPDGRWLAAVSTMKGKVQVWDAARRQLAGRFDLASTSGLAFSPDSTRLAAVARGSRRLQVWDLTQQRMAQSPVPIGSPKMAFAPDGRTLVTFSREYFEFWDLATGNLRASFHQGEETVKGGIVIEDWVLSPDGRTLATATRRGRLVFREAATGRTRLEIRMSGVRSLCFLSGRVLAVTAPDGPIALLDVRTGEVLHRLEGHNASAWDLSASADGTRLASRVWQQDVLIWDTRRWAGRLAVPANGRTDEALWADLTGADAAAAYNAVWGFVSRSDEAVAFLAGRLTPKEVEAPDPDRLKRLIADLDDARFATREAASRELTGHGHVVEAAVRAALRSESPEVRRRAQAILRRLRPPVTPGQDRALEVLEHIGTTEAATLLRRLAAGLEEAPLSEAAELALGRLRPTGGR